MLMRTAGLIALLTYAPAYAAPVSGLSVDIELPATRSKHAATIDVRTQAVGVDVRIDLVDGPKAGQRLLGHLPADGTPRFWVYRPALGIEPARLDQVERRFQRMGVSLFDLLAALNTPVSRQDSSDPAACADEWTRSTAGHVERAALCARGSLKARNVSVRGHAADTATPTAIDIVDADGTSVHISVAQVATPRWQADTRYQREHLAD